MFEDIVPPHRGGAAARRGVRLSTLILIRWGAIAGQAVTLLTVYHVLGFPVHLNSGLTVVGASVLLNLVLTALRPAGERPNEAALTALFGFDIVQLAVLLHLTGGLENPFSFLLLAPLTVSATILGPRSTALLGGLALTAVTVLALDHAPLPWPRPGFALPDTYVMGAWVALALGIGFFAAYTWRVAEEARRMQNALAATQLALAREQRLSALGGIAAAAAHELGTPLGTISVVARELARELGPGSPVAGDVELLIGEAGRCREILAGLESSGAESAAAGYPEMPLDAVIEAAARRHAGPAVALDVRAAAEGPGAAEPPLVPNMPEIVHGVGNLVQNAAQFARSRVAVTTRWSAARIRVTVEDDGPGFPPRLLERLGEPYLSTRPGSGGHMGLGIFIARALLERIGAEVGFDNPDSGGARVRIVWDRSGLSAAARAAGAEGVSQ